MYMHRQLNVLFHIYFVAENTSGTNYYLLEEHGVFLLCNTFHFFLVLPMIVVAISGGAGHDYYVSKY